MSGTDPEGDEPDMPAEDAANKMHARDSRRPEPEGGQVSASNATALSAAFDATTAAKGLVASFRSPAFKVAILEATSATKTINTPAFKAAVLEATSATKTINTPAFKAAVLEATSATKTINTPAFKAAVLEATSVTKTINTPAFKAAVLEATSATKTINTPAFKAAILEATSATKTIDTPAFKAAILEATSATKTINTPAFKAAILEATSATKTINTPAFKAALAATVAQMPRVDASSLAASVARSIATDFLNVGVRYGAEESAAAVVRRVAFLDTGKLARLYQAARASEPSSVATDEVIQSVTKKAAYAAPPPIDSDGLLVDDAAAVTRWISMLVSRALAASGLSERDLTEDAVAAWVYLMVASIVLALLLNLPLFAALGGMLGVAAHPPAKVAAKLGRQAYRRLNDNG